MAAGVTDRLWDVNDLVALCEQYERRAGSSMMWKRALSVTYDRKALIRSTVLYVILLAAAIVALYWARRHTLVDKDVAYPVWLWLALVAILGLIKSVRALRRGPEKPV